MSNHFQRFIQNSSGAALIEFSIIAILYFLFILGSIGWAFLFWMENGNQFVSERSARCLSLQLPIDSSGNEINRVCDSYADPTKQKASWLPGFSYSSTNPQTNSVSGGTSTDLVSRSYTNAGTTKTYSSYCILISMNNPLMLGIMRDFGGAPSALSRRYCRPVP